MPNAFCNKDELTAFFDKLDDEVYNYQHYKVVRLNPCGARFKYHSYFNEAISELTNRMIQAINMDELIEIIENYISEMDECACKCRSKDNMFSVAKSAGDWILDIALAR